MTEEAKTEEAKTEEPKSAGRVGIVLVNYNGGKFMPDCLASLANLDYSDAYIVVVDNASTDGSADEAEALYPNIAVVRHTANLGITGGNNAGMDWCRANKCEYILLLNNDTVVKPDFLSNLLAQAEPDCLLVPKIYFHDNKTLINNHFGTFDYWRGIHRDWFYGRSDTPASRRIQSTATMANTCALLIPQQVAGRVGPMDDIYFIYSDDTDFITRAVRSGSRIKFVPNAVLYHRESSSSGGTNSPLAVYYTTRNRLYFMRKHQKNPVVLGFFWVYFTLTRLAVAANYLRRGQRLQLRALWNGVSDFLQGEMGCAPSSRFSS